MPVSVLIHLLILSNLNFSKNVEKMILFHSPYKDHTIHYARFTYKTQNLIIFNGSFNYKVIRCIWGSFFCFYKNVKGLKIQQNSREYGAQVHTMHHACISLKYNYHRCGCVSICSLTWVRVGQRSVGVDNCREQYEKRKDEYVPEEDQKRRF